MRRKPLGILLSETATKFRYLPPSAEGITYFPLNKGQYVLPFSTVDNKTFFSTSPDYKASYGVTSFMLVDNVPPEDTTWNGVSLTLEFGMPLRVIDWALGGEARGTDHPAGVLTYNHDGNEFTNDDGSHYYYFDPYNDRTGKGGKLGWLDGTVFGFNQPLTTKRGEETLISGKVPTTLVVRNFGKDTGNIPGMNYVPTLS